MTMHTEVEIKDELAGTQAEADGLSLSKEC